jgi:hypothetical protein
MRCVFWPTVHGPAIQCPAVGQSGLLNSGPLWHAAKISVFTSVPQGAFGDEDEDAARLVEPKILCMAEIREIRPGGPGRHRRCPPGWWRPRRQRLRLASLADQCAIGLRKGPQAGFAAVAIRISHHFAAVCPDIEPFVAEGFVALAMANGRQRMVLWGGNRKLLGTSPMPFASPRPSRLPLV